MCSNHGDWAFLADYSSWNFFMFGDRQKKHFSPPGSHNSRPWDPSGEKNLRPSLRYLLWMKPKVALCFYVWVMTRFSRIRYLQSTQNPRFCRRHPPGAIIVVVGTQVVKETSAQALDTFCGWSQRYHYASMWGFGLASLNFTTVFYDFIVNLGGLRPPRRVRAYNSTNNHELNNTLIVSPRDVYLVRL